MAKRPQMKPLKRFEYKLVEAKFDGLLINVDRDLQRIGNAAEIARDLTGSRCLGLLNVMVRFAKNSHHAARYLVADTPEDPRRRPNYALALAPMNRQLLDLLFSLAYMLDDFPTRSLEYQRAGWREAKEEYQRFKTEFSGNPDWQPFFASFRETLERLAPVFHISEREKKSPRLIPYWKHPGDLKNKQSASREFLRWLDKWLYGDTSAQAHLSCGGLLMVSPFLVADLIGGQNQQILEDRGIQQYRFLQFSRNALVTLAVVTEIDYFCNLGNREVISYLWAIFGDHVAEGREMYKVRYEEMLSRENPRPSQRVTKEFISSLVGSCKGPISMVEAHEREHRSEDEARQKKLLRHFRTK